MKKSFILHNDSLEVLDDLTDEQCGQLFRAIKSYQIGEQIELTSITKIAFSPFKSQFARDEEKYQKIVERNKINGPKGGRPKNPKEPTGLSRNPKKPRKADSGSKSDSDSGSKEILIPVGINAVAWNEWIAYRQSKKKKVSKAAAAKQFKLLANHALDVQQQIINQSIQNDYQGLFEPKGNSNGSYQQTNQPSRKLSVVERTKLANEERERARQAREGYGSPLAEASGNIRPPIEQPIRGDNSRELGTVIDGSFSRAD